MINFYENIQAQGWDNFMLSIEKEFDTIKEELNIFSNKDPLSHIEILNIRAIGKNNLDTIVEINSPDDIKTEFKKLREELNILVFEI